MAVPDKCWFVTPWPTPVTSEQREENWLYMERWANTVLLAPDADCFCHHCQTWANSTMPERCWFKVPYPSTDDPDEEEINWYALQRWVNDVLPQCWCGQVQHG